MIIKSLKISVSEKIAAALPGPVIKETPVTRKTPAKAEGSLPLILSLAFASAHAIGMPMKVVTCRRQGVPVKDDGSHEVRYVIPSRVKLPVAGTTI